MMAAFQRIANEFDLPADMSTSSVGFKSTMLNNIYCALPKLKPVVESILQVLDLRKARDGLKPDMFKEEYEPEAITDLKDVLLTVEAEVSIPHYRGAGGLATDRHHRSSRTI